MQPRQEQCGFHLAIDLCLWYRWRGRRKRTRGLDDELGLHVSGSSYRLQLQRVGVMMCGRMYDA